MTIRFNIPGTHKIVESYHYSKKHGILGAIKNQGQYTGWTLVDKNGIAHVQTWVLEHSASNPISFEE